MLKMTADFFRASSILFSVMVISSVEPHSFTYYLLNVSAPSFLLIHWQRYRILGFVQRKWFALK